MWYGLNRKRFLETLVVFAAIGVVACLFGLVAALIDSLRLDADRVLTLLFLLLFVPCLWLILGMILASTWLRVNGTELEWYLWRRILLMRCSAADVTRMESGSFSAVIIRTRRGPIRLFGLHLTDRAALWKHLMELNPQLADGS